MAITTTSALIIVDVQNDFLPGGALAVADGDAVIAPINRLAALFPHVVATQDWHPTNHGSFAANHPPHRPGEVIDLFGLPQVLWPVHCVQNTPGAMFAETLDHSLIQRVFQKGVDPHLDSYSGFFDNGHRGATGLGDYLKNAGITDVYVAGLATDYCVKFTALDAAGLGFTTHLIEDAVRGVELHPGDVAAAVQAMHNAGVQIVQTADLG